MAAKSDSKTSDFIVRLGMQLPDQVKARIASAIQATVMTELGKTDLGGDGGLLSFDTPPHWRWRGKWINVVFNPEQGEQFGKSSVQVTLGVTATEG